VQPAAGIVRGEPIILDDGAGVKVDGGQGGGCKATRIQPRWRPQQAAISERTVAPQIGTGEQKKKRIFRPSLPAWAAVAQSTITVAAPVAPKPLDIPT